MTAAVALLEVRGLLVRKGGADLLEIPALAVASGETLALIGPNGAGKSTLLLGLCGIEPSAAGVLCFRGAPVPAGAAALAYRRRVAMVFQEPLLLDTTVFENVATGPKLHGLTRGEIARRVGENLERFRIAHLADRSARTLSGGEAQRASLARALAVEPEILLLDEPFAALDPPSREGLLEDLAHTLRHIGATTVFATHDRVEAQRLADRIAVLDRGRLRQVGTAEEVLRRPADACVAAFVGVENLIPVRMAPTASGEGLIAQFGGSQANLDATRRGSIALEVGGVAPGLISGSEGLLCIRPEDIMLAAPGSGRDHSTGNRLPGRVVAVIPHGPGSKVTIDCGVRVVAAVSRQVIREQGLTPGSTVTLALRSSDLYVIPAEGR